MFILDLSVPGASGPSEGNNIKPSTTEGVKGPNLNKPEGAPEIGKVIANIVSNPFANFYKYFKAAQNTFNLSDKDAHKIARRTAERYGDLIPPEDKGISLDRNL